jgi:hypothetical protein
MLRLDLIVGIRLGSPPVLSMRAFQIESPGALPFQPGGSILYTQVSKSEFPLAVKVPCEMRGIGYCQTELADHQTFLARSSELT